MAMKNGENGLATTAPEQTHAIDNQVKKLHDREVTRASSNRSLKSRLDSLESTQLLFHHE